MFGLRALRARHANIRVIFVTATDSREFFIASLRPPQPHVNPAFHAGFFWKSANFSLYLTNLLSCVKLPPMKKVRRSCRIIQPEKRIRGLSGNTVSGSLKRGYSSAPNSRGIIAGRVCSHCAVINRPSDSKSACDATPRRINPCTIGCEATRRPSITPGELEQQPRPAVAGHDFTCGRELPDHLHQRHVPRLGCVLREDRHRIPACENQRVEFTGASPQVGDHTVRLQPYAGVGANRGGRSHRKHLAGDFMLEERFEIRKQSQSVHRIHGHYSHSLCHRTESF